MQWLLILIMQLFWFLSWIIKDFYILKYLAPEPSTRARIIIRGSFPLPGDYPDPIQGLNGVQGCWSGRCFCGEGAQPCTKGDAPSPQDGPLSAVSFFLGLELPQINYAHNGKPYRYVFAIEVQRTPIPNKVLIPGRSPLATVLSVYKAEFSGSQTGWPWLENGGQEGGPLGDRR